MRRVVVTGLGMVTPLACGVEATWKRLIAGESAARKIDRFEVADLPAQIACQIPRGDGANSTYNPDQWMEPKEQRKVDEFIVFAMCAARQALDDSGWKPKTSDEQKKAQQKEEEPPEEDESIKPKEYSFNPLEAEKNLKIGNYYFKKGNYKAALGRFREASHWNPNYAEAYLRLGESEEKLKDKAAAAEAYAKFLELAPDAKEAESVKRKLAVKR